MLKLNPRNRFCTTSATAYKPTASDWAYPLLTLVGTGKVINLCRVVLIQVPALSSYPAFWKIRVLDSNSDGWEYECHNAVEAHERWYELLELPEVSTTHLKSIKFQPT